MRACEGCQGRGGISLQRWNILSVASTLLTKCLVFIHRRPEDPFCCAWNTLCLTAGGLPRCPAESRTEGRVTDPDCMGEISRGKVGEVTQTADEVRMDELGLSCISKGQVTEPSS